MRRKLVDKKGVKFSDVAFRTWARQLNADDLAYNIRICSIWAEANGHDTFALEALDAVHRDASPTYKKLSDEYKGKYPAGFWALPILVEEEAS